MSQNKSSYFVNKNVSRKEFEQFIFEWNVRFPFDRWWRRKYNIPFNSLEHRKMSLIDIKYEYEEERYLKKYFSDKKRLQEEKDDRLRTGHLLRFTQEDDDDLFDKINWGDEDENNVSI